jgi:carbon monoxide dehydrogenase subunit G
MPVFEEEFEIRAPIDTVWGFLLDPARLAPCIPGCDEVRVEDEHTWRLRLTVKVGFLSTTQEVKLTITEANPPRHLVSVGRGEDKKLGGRTEVKTTLDLAPVEPDRTLVRYRSEARVLGALGSVGDAVMRVKAGQMAAEFAARVRTAVEESP